MAIYTRPSYIALLLLIFMPPTFALAQVSYGPPQNYAVTGSTPFRIATADFNHDSYADLADLATVDVYSPIARLGIRLNNGNGTYGSEIALDGGPGASDIVFGDFDGDGVLDIAVNNPGGCSGSPPNMTCQVVMNVRIFYGDGNGGFRSPVDVAVDGAPNSVTAADFNNDGRLDLATISRPANAGMPGTITLLLSNGDATFTRKSFTVPSDFWTQQFGAGFHDATVSIVAGDWNGDGKMDLAYVASCAECDVAREAIFELMNDGSANFTRISRPTAGGTGIKRLHAADIDLDGRSDIYAMYFGCHTPCVGLAIFYNNGDGTAALGGIDTSYSAGGLPEFTDPALSDVDNDGIMDFVFSTTPGRVYDPATGTSSDRNGGITVVRGTGSRKFGTPQFFGDLGSNWPRLITQGLINADGRMDVVTFATGQTSNSSVLSVWMNTSAGGNCLYPSTAAGVNICSPGDGASAGGDMQISATGKGVYGPVQRMEVWMDGSKQLQIFNDEVNSRLNIPSGKHTITINAVDFAGQVSKMSIQTAGNGGNSPDFAVSDSPQSAAVKRGDAASFTITVTPQNGFNNAVALSCSGLPAGANCTFSPSSVTPGGGPANSTLKITTTAATAMLHVIPTFYALSFSSFSVAVLGLCWLPRRARTRKLVLVAVLLISAFVIVQAGCGGGGSKGGDTPATGGTPPATPPSAPPPGGGSSGGTPVGSYTVMVVASSGSIQHATNLQLNVQ
jgi:hypothetical protein